MVRTLSVFCILYIVSLKAFSAEYIEKSIFGIQYKVPVPVNFYALCEEDFNTWSVLNKTYRVPNKTHLTTCISSRFGDGVEKPNVLMLFANLQSRDRDIDKAEFRQFIKELEGLLENSDEELRKKIKNATGFPGVEFELISGLDKPIKFKHLRKDDDSYIAYASTFMAYKINGTLVEEDNLKVQGYLLLKNHPIEIQASFSDYSAQEKEQALKDINMWITSLLEANKI